MIVIAIGAGVMARSDDDTPSLAVQLQRASRRGRGPAGVPHRRAHQRDSAATWRVVIDADGRAFVTPHDLAVLGDDLTYQLWSMDEEPISLGSAGPDPTVAVLTSAETPRTWGSASSRRRAAPPPRPTCGRRHARREISCGAVIQAGRRPRSGGVPAHPPQESSPMKSPRIGLFVVGLAALSLVAAACSDDGDSSASTNTSTTSPMAPADSDADSASLTAENFGAGCAAVPTDGAGSFAGMAQDPAATAASNNPALSTLVAAVTAADLGDTLNGARSVHDLRPEQRRLRQAIPQADARHRCSPIPTGDLTRSSPTTSSPVSSSTPQQLADAGTETTVNGADVTIAEAGDTIEVNGQSAVVCGNVKTANGTVHIIDTVLMPPG